MDGCKGYCKGYWSGNPIDGYDFYCGYGEFDCADCMFGPFGEGKDPRQGQKGGGSDGTPARH